MSQPSDEGSNPFGVEPETAVARPRRPVHFIVEDPIIKSRYLVEEIGDGGLPPLSGTPTLPDIQYIKVAPKHRATYFSLLNAITGVIEGNLINSRDKQRLEEALRAFKDAVIV